MFCIADNIFTALMNSMSHWKMCLHSNNEYLGYAMIKSEIFQGDSFSTLLFVMVLIPISIVLQKVRTGYQFGKDRAVINPLHFMKDLKLFSKSESQIDFLLRTVREYSNDVRMQFGISKCVVLTMKK